MNDEICNKIKELPIVVKDKIFKMWFAAFAKNNDLTIPDYNIETINTIFSIFSQFNEHMYGYVTVNSTVFKILEKNFPYAKFSNNLLKPEFYEKYIYKCNFETSQWVCDGNNQAFTEYVLNDPHLEKFYSHFRFEINFIKDYSGTYESISSYYFPCRRLCSILLSQKYDCSNHIFI